MFVVGCVMASGSSVIVDSFLVVSDSAAVALCSFEVVLIRSTVIGSACLCVGLTVVVDGAFLVGSTEVMVGLVVVVVTSVLIDSTVVVVS